MVRNFLLPAVVSIVLISPAQAGEIKIHEWPTQFIPQEVTTIPVVMDVGFFIRIKDQDKLKIKLLQKAISEYEGCTDMVVEANFNMTLTCSIAGTGAIAGDYSCTVAPANLDAPGGTVTVCAKLKDANLTTVPGGTKNVHVATVTIKVIPRV